MKKTIRVVGCIMQCDNEILMLLRSTKETDPSLWGIPGGKVETGESDLQAVRREIYEETGIQLERSELTYIGYLPIEYDTFMVEFPVFHSRFQARPSIKLRPEEHIDLVWVTPEEALKLPDLMKDVDVIIQKFCVEKLGIQ